MLRWTCGRGHQSPERDRGREGEALFTADAVRGECVLGAMDDTLRTG